MDRLEIKQGGLKAFIAKVQKKLELESEELGKLLNLSGRTIRDWKREKFKPTKDHIDRLSRLSGIDIPDFRLLPQYWNIPKAAKLGGKRRHEIYGLLGDLKTRSKGGRNSWLKRKDHPELWIKYTKPCNYPGESEDLAEFMGIFLGDGGLTHFQCVIYLNSDTDQEFAYYVQDLIIRLFNIVPSITKSRKYKVWRVSVSSVNLVEYLTRKGLSLGNKVLLQARVPVWVSLKPEYIKACIRGLIDTDGSFIIHKYKVKGKEYSYPKISFTNRSLPLIDFVYTGLMQYGFTPKKSYKYQVWLHNQNEVMRYLKEVGVRNYRPNIIKVLRRVA